MIERILNNHQTRLQSEPSPYRLDPEQAAEFEKIEAPEIVITGKNLREALDIVGGYIHAQVQLVKGDSDEYDIVRFRKLGGTEKAKLAYTVGEWLNEVKSECDKSFEGHDEFQNTIINMTFNDETLAQYNEEQQKAFEEELKAQQHIAMPRFKNVQPCEPQDE